MVVFMFSFAISCNMSSALSPLLFAATFLTRFALVALRTDLYFIHGGFILDPCFIVLDGTCFCT